MRIEQEPIKAGESGLIAYVTNRFDFLFDHSIHGRLEGDVLEVTFGLVDLKKRVFRLFGLKTSNN